MAVADFSRWLGANCKAKFQGVCYAGSGKTYTIAGNPESSSEQGLLTRSVNCLAQGIKEITDGSQFQVKFTTCYIRACVSPQFTVLRLHGTSGTSQCNATETWCSTTPYVPTACS